MEREKALLRTNIKKQDEKEYSEPTLASMMEFICKKC